MLPSPFLRSLIAIMFSINTLAITTHLKAATPLYSETFTTSTVGTSGTNWIVTNTINIAGTAYGSIGKTTNDSLSIAPSGQAGNLYAYAQNNTQSPNLHTATVDYFFRTSNTTASASLFTSLIPNNHSILQASWQSTIGGTMSDGVTSMKYFFAVQVGTTWYAAATNGTSGYTGGTAGVFYTLDLLNTNWYTISFTPGTSMSLNLATTPTSSATLFNGGAQISGLGWYVKDLPGASSSTTDYRTIRFDNMTIGVPEPSRATLFALAFTAVIFRRSRAKRHL